MNRTFGYYFDGESITRQRVELDVIESEWGVVLEMTLPGGEEAVLWPVYEVRSLPDQSSVDRLICGLTQSGPARLIVEEQKSIELMLNFCPHLYKPLRKPSRIWAGLFAAGCAVFLSWNLVQNFVPRLADYLAPSVDLVAERRLGALTYDHLRLGHGRWGEPARECRTPDGTAALTEVIRRMVGDQRLAHPLKVVVLDDRHAPVVNAYALPGGRVVFFDSFLQEVTHPNQVAAVFAHELGHVVHRDTVRSALKRAPLTLLVTLYTGDISSLIGTAADSPLGGMAAKFSQMLISNAYSREAEEQADTYAHERMLAAQLPPTAIGDLFDTLSGGRHSASHDHDAGALDALGKYLSSHPDSGDRIEASQAWGDIYRSETVLDGAAWQALQNICR